MWIVSVIDPDQGSEFDIDSTRLGSLEAARAFAAGIAIWFSKRDDAPHSLKIQPPSGEAEIWTVSELLTFDYLFGGDKNADRS